MEDEDDDWGWCQPLTRQPTRAETATGRSIEVNTDITENLGEPQQPDSPQAPIELEENWHYEELQRHGQGQDPEDEIPREPFCDSPIRTALEALVNNNITLVEYGAQVQFRCGYEEVPVVVEWAVPDDQLQHASQTLLEHNFPLLHHGVRPEFGYWDTGCRRHGLDSIGWMRVHLLPLSLVGLTLDETIDVSSMFAPKLRILTPLPTRYMLSLIRHLKKLPLRDSSRLRVEKDLLGFIGYYIVRDPPPELQQSDEPLQKKLQRGVELMRTFDWGNVDQDELATAERLVLDCRRVSKLTDVVEDLD
ncbi:uncharacterized protein N7496_004963 [Penicillium cataractarum]|uniref:Uncharacterized protein n=1 Tax=Penicillium cataractarum TaxID=2100454 RepID=A0A9W9SHW0_9EURO|nr:uncharacterized protein N7496_004963 [Penicillium cataractarum]KAJ5377554.1 hypothetical protein N7496_004963 [Penicillium cataractarum]